MTKMAPDNLLREPRTTSTGTIKDSGPIAIRTPLAMSSGTSLRLRGNIPMIVRKQTTTTTAAKTTRLNVGQLGWRSDVPQTPRLSRKVKFNLTVRCGDVKSFRAWRSGSRHLDRCECSVVDPTESRHHYNSSLRGLPSQRDVHGEASRADPLNTRDTAISNQDSKWRLDRYRRMDRQLEKPNQSKRAELRSALFCYPVGLRIRVRNDGYRGCKDWKRLRATAFEQRVAKRSDG